MKKGIKSTKIEAKLSKQNMFLGLHPNTGQGITDFPVWLKARMAQLVAPAGPEIQVETLARKFFILNKKHF